PAGSGLAGGVADPPPAGGGGRLDEVGGALDVHGAAVLERLAAPGAVEYDVPPRHGRRERLGASDVAVHALEAEGRRPARKALADERAHRHVAVEQAVDHTLADEAVGAGDEGASHPGIHAAILP